MQFFLLILLFIRDVQTCGDATEITRQQWGARETKSVSNLTLPTNTVFIHHTASTFCFNKQDCSQEAKAIQDFHMDVHGWDDIGYNFLIGEDGRVYVGRGWDRIGAHTYGWNGISVAFAFMGDFSNRLPDQKALTALQGMLTCGVNLGKLTQNYEIRGHRDARPTESPGDSFYSLIQTWSHFWINKANQKQLTK